MTPRRALDILPDRLSRAMAVIGVAAYILGTLSSILLGEHHLFQRFGSIGVAAAILFFTDRLLQIELRRQKTVERILHEYGLELEVLREGIDPRDLPATGFLTDYLEEEVQFEALRDRSARINSRNIFLLTIATLQWGFGDAFLNWVTS
ncbi:MAG: hypothetical protein WBN04_04965 [Paracoccaceae bacterium]